MIEDCDSAVVIWMNNSGVIANNLEILKRLGKPTFLYECSSETGKIRAGELDPNRTHNPFYHMKERYWRQKRNHRGHQIHVLAHSERSSDFDSRKIGFWEDFTTRAPCMTLVAVT